jgi:hypothetical protein
MAAISAVLLLSSCSDVVLKSNLGLAGESVAINPNITVTDNRAIKGIELQGLRAWSTMDEIETVPPVAEVVRAKLSGGLSRLRKTDRLSASVVSASCQIANHLNKASASFELRVDAQLRVSGQQHSKMLVAGTSKRGFDVGFKGVPAKQWCSNHFVAASQEIAAEAATYYSQLIGE